MNDQDKPLVLDPLLWPSMCLVEKTQHLNDTLSLKDEDYIKHLAKTSNLYSTICYFRENYWTKDECTQVVLAQLDVIATQSEPVLVLGEPGVGKEILARGLHAVRKGGYIPVNAAELTGNLLRSELFGYKQGAFTGAKSDQSGLVAAATNGTLFIDEIGELPLESQSVLLRLLENRLYRPVGATQELYTNARFVFATNRNLPKMVKEGFFRQDLYDRLSTFTFKIPPLRDRVCDIEHLLLRFECELCTTGMSMVFKYRWPGNVRELKAFAARAKHLGIDYAFQQLDV